MFPNQRATFYSFSRGFILSAPSLRFTIHFDLVFVLGVMVRVNAHYFAHGSLTVLALFVEKSSLPIALGCKSIEHISEDLFLDLTFYTTDPCIYPYANSTCSWLL